MNLYTSIGDFTGFIIFGACFFLRKGAANPVSSTERNSYLANHSVKTFFTEDWLNCCLACHAEEKCISYNFDGVLGTCDLNDQGLQEPFIGPAELVKAQGVMFHQIRPARQPLIPRLVQSAGLCDCSCTSETACSPGRGSYDRLPVSCKQIWETTSIRQDESFYIQTKTTSQHALVFCHMTPIPGCGDGGWTLVMKIDGNKTTFGYGASLWENTLPHNENGGTSLQTVETKLSSYWSTPFTRLCLGMKYENEAIRWISVNYTASSLYDVVSKGTETQTQLDVSKWKDLIRGSKLEESCTKQGFNIRGKDSKSAKARIGIIGQFPSCSGTASSRIGFGTAGSIYGMSDSNSCGNENGRSSFRKKAFGYILVH